MRKSKVRRDHVRCVARHAFTRATRAVEAAKALRERGIDRHVVRDAIEKARAHVGTRDLSLAQWIAIAENYLEVKPS